MRILAAVSTKLFSAAILLGVDFAATSAEVMRSLHQARYDVLVLESLADQSAEQLARKLRQDGWPIPIILLSQKDPGLQGVTWIRSPGTVAEVEQAIQRAANQAPLARDDSLSTLVSATAYMGAQVAGMREDLTAFQHRWDQYIQHMNSKFDELRSHGDKQRELIISGVDNSVWKRVHHLMVWSTEHPVASLAYFMAILILLAAMVAALRVAGPDNIKLLRESLPSSSQGSS